MGDWVKGIQDFVRTFSDPVPVPGLVDDPSGKGAIVVVRNGYDVKRLPGEPQTRRTHVFHELRSFAEWLNRHAKGETAEILVGEEQAAAVLGDDPHASQVTCELRHHPTFEAWQNVLGRALSPKDLFAFVRSVAETFSVPTAEGGPNVGDVLAGELAKLKAVTTGDVEASVDPRGFYSVQGATQKVQVDAKIPPQFLVWSPIYVGVPSEPGESGAEKLYPLPILLSMDVTEKGIAFTLTCPSLERILHDARGDALEHLRKLLDGGFLVGLGDLQSAIVPG